MTRIATRIIALVREGTLFLLRWIAGLLIVELLIPTVAYAAPAAPSALPVSNAWKRRGLPLIQLLPSCHQDLCRFLIKVPFFSYHHISGIYGCCGCVCVHLCCFRYLSKEVPDCSRRFMWRAFPYSLHLCKNCRRRFNMRFSITFCHS